MAKVTWNFTLKSTPWKKRQIKIQRNFYTRIAILRCS